MVSRLAPALLAAVVLVTAPAGAQSSTPNPKLPTLYVVGDLPPQSTADVFDPARLNLAFSPASGQTTRAYIHSGAWDTVLAKIKPGDLVLLEFLPAGLSASDRASATRVLQGVGDGTFDYLDPGTQKLELVHSYGWYLRKMVVDAINHGANPILCAPPGSSPTSTIMPTASEPAAGEWTQAIATEQRIPFVKLTDTGLRAGLEALQPDPLEPYLKKK